MPRRSSGGRSAPRPSARSSSSKPPSKPAAAAPASASAPIQRGNGIGAAIVDGLAWGTGTSIAHRAVESVLGPRVVKYESVASPEPAAASAPTANSVASTGACGNQTKALSDCLSNFGTDICKCQFYMDMLQECRRGSGAAMGA